MPLNVPNRESVVETLSSGLEMREFVALVTGLDHVRFGDLSERIVG